MMIARAFISVWRNRREHSGVGYKEAVARVLYRFYEKCSRYGQRL